MAWRSPTLYKASQMCLYKYCKQSQGPSHITYTVQCALTRLICIAVIATPALTSQTSDYFKMSLLLLGRTHIQHTLKNIYSIQPHFSHVKISTFFSHDEAKWFVFFEGFFGHVSIFYVFLLPNYRKNLTV